MLDGLPKGWVKTTLREVCLPVGTIQPADSPDIEFTYFDIGGIDNKSNRIAETKTLTGRTAPSRARQAVRKDDILFSTVRTYLRNIARVEGDYSNPVASTGFAVIRAAQGVSSQFLFFQVLSKDFLEPLHVLQTGTSYPAVRAREVLAQPILLPPTSEQERIVAKLTFAFSGVERAEAAARRARKRLQRYRAAVLHAAVTGELTRAWREAQQKSGKKNSETGEALLRRILKVRRDEWDGKGGYKEPVPPVAGILQKPPEGWTTASLEQLTSANRVICYGILMPKEHVSGGIAYVKVRDMKGDKIDLASLSRTSREIATKYARASLKSGDILLAIRGTYGRVAEVPPELDGGNITQDTARLAFTRLVDRRYLASFLRSEHAQDYFNRVARGVAVKGVNIGDVRPCPILLPPLAEQAEIVRQVERRLSAADRLEATLEQQLVRARATRQSLLRDAFTGRLVPQDPDDEPASVLLERIRTAREVEAHKWKGKRMPKPKPKMKAPGRRNLLAVLKEKGGPMTPEELFRVSGHSQESVDEFFAELRDLTTAPAKIVEERRGAGATLLRAVP